MTDRTLPPAAQAVAWAYDNAPEKPTDNHRYYWLAAALRAAAEAVASPEQADPDNQWDLGYVAACAAIYGDLHAIAAELEDQ